MSRSKPPTGAGGGRWSERKGRSVLLLSFYFEPDLCAGSFRATALADALLDELPDDVAVDLVTTLPNRYSTFRREAPVEELRGRLRIRRVPLPDHRSGFLDQTLAFARFAWRAARLTRGNRYDLVVATSSRLMTATLGAVLARRAGAPLYLDIRDLFADTIQHVLPRRVPFLVSAFRALERWTVRRAARVNLVSPGFGPYFAERYPDQPRSFFTNGIDEEFLGSRAAGGAIEPAMEPRNPSGPIRIVYAGNIGEGQGLETILPPLARRLEGRATFRIIGDGGRRPRLEASVAEAGIRSVELVPPMPRDQLIREYLAADVLFLHLNDYDAFRKVLPSKVFEYAALQKPILAGVAGYPAAFLEEEVTNAAVFPPCDADGAVRALDQLELRDVDRSAFIGKYRRRDLMSGLARDIADHLPGRAAR